MNFNQKVSDYIANAQPKQMLILETLRQLVHESQEGVTEDIKWRMPVFSNGKNFTYLQLTKNHISLGFYQIDKLQDPKNLLEGEGNALRHIKIKELPPSLVQQIKKWLDQIAQ